MLFRPILNQIAYSASQKSDLLLFVSSKQVWNQGLDLKVCMWLFLGGVFSCVVEALINILHLASKTGMGFVGKSIEVGIFLSLIIFFRAELGKGAVAATVLTSAAKVKKPRFGYCGPNLTLK
jgi:hypothetical protein